MKLFAKALPAFLGAIVLLMPLSCTKAVIEQGKEDDSSSQQETSYEVTCDVQDEDLVFEALESEGSMQIKADGPWTLEAEEVDGKSTKSLASWVFLSITGGGSGVFGVDIGLGRNTSGLVRTARLILRGKQVIQTWTIVQQPQYYSTDGIVTIAIMEAGTFRESIKNYHKDPSEITKLRIVGEFNGSDLNYLYDSEMANLTYLDVRGLRYPDFSLSYHRKLQYLYLPNIQKVIGSNAFSSNSALEYIHGENVEITDYRAIAFCGKLSGYYLPNLVEIGQECFSGDESLETLAFQNVTTIKDRAFAGCSLVSTVSFDLLEEIDQQFNGWGGMDKIEVVNLPKLKKTGIGAFAYQTKLETLVLPSLTEMGHGIINQSSVTEINCPALGVIPESAFAGNTVLRTVSFESVYKVERAAFLNCTKLKNVSMPHAITLGSQAFYACTLGGELDFSSVMTIGDYCFAQSEGINSHALRFPLALTIGDGAFSDCKNIVSIEIPMANSIGAMAFMNCTRLANINGDNSLIAISLGNDAFTNCQSLHELLFPVLIKLGGYCFEGTKLRHLYFGCLNWKPMENEDDLWPLAPFEFWNFPISQDVAQGIYLELGDDPGKPDPEHPKPWWSQTVDAEGKTHWAFMRRVWDRVNDY